MMDTLYPIFGLLLASTMLMLGAEILIRVCKLFSSALGVSEAFSGVTLMSIATSAPEIFVSLDAHLTNHTALALGNLAGSNIANILLVYGLGCLFVLKPSHSRRLLSRNDMLMFFLATCIFLVVIFYNFYGIFAGATLFLLYIGYIGFSYMTERNGKKHQAFSNSSAFTLTIVLKMLTYSIFGAVILYASAELMIHSGINFARLFDIPEGTIGLTAIAIGTSLPELAVLLLSSKRMSEEFVVANIVGSNIFNIIFIPGLMFLVFPLQTEVKIANVGLIFFVLGSLLFVIKSQLGQKFLVSSGIVFLVLYAMFILELAL